MKEKVTVFIKTFAVIFPGLILCNVVRTVIEALIYDGGISFSNIIALPYLLYGLFSAVLSSAFVVLINRLKK